MVYEVCEYYEYDLLCEVINIYIIIESDVADSNSAQDNGFVLLCFC